MSQITAEQLAVIPMFRKLDHADRWLLATWFDKATPSSKRQLTHRTANSYAFAFIASGTADIVEDGEVVRTLGRGDFFGELSRNGRSDGRRAATVVVTAPSEIWTMFSARFRALEAECPDIAVLVEQTARERADATGH